MEGGEGDRSREISKKKTRNRENEAAVRFTWRHVEKERSRGRTDRRRNWKERLWFSSSSKESFEQSRYLVEVNRRWSDRWENLSSLGWNNPWERRGE